MIKEIASGKYRVLESGSVILYNNESSLKMTIEPGNGFHFIVEIIFFEDENRPQSMEKEVEAANNLIRFRCINFDNALGTGTTYPLDLATYNNKQISFHMWSFLLGNKSSNHTRRIDYTYYIDE